jgi:hypothetical protein
LQCPAAGLAGSDRDDLASSFPLIVESSVMQLGRPGRSAMRIAALAVNRQDTGFTRPVAT